MTAQGEDLLAWLDRDITQREQAALDADRELGRTWSADWDHSTDTFNLSTDTGHVVAARLLPASSKHVTTNDPASVLRRCAADRKLIYEVRRTATNAKDRPWDPMYGPYADAMLAAAKVVAEGYGWTGGER